MDNCLFVSSSQLPESPGKDNLAVVPGDPRSPTYVDSSLHRTPLQIKNDGKLHDMSEDSIFLSTNVTSSSPMPQLLGPPKQSLLDPRSPSIGVDRTPLNCGQVPASESLEVHTNYSNLADLAMFDLDQEISMADYSELLITSDRKHSSSTPIKQDGEKKEAISVSASKVPRTPLQLLSPHTPNMMNDSSPMVFKLKGSASVPSKKSNQVKNTPTIGIQKQALTNRLRRDIGLVDHEKEN